jgi:outer membrane protein OmpA-like peptidoglycan-associated protein
MSGTHVDHCFPGPGKYRVTLDLIDLRTGSLYFHKQTYDIEIIDYNQPYINSNDYAVVGDAIEFDAMKSYCPGFKITGYFWDFGDGTQKVGAGPTHTYKTSGEFDVRLGLTLKSQTTGDVSKKSVLKKIKVFASRPEMESSLASRPAAGPEETDLRHYENVRILDHYSAEEEYMKEAVFQVEILSSPTKMELTNPIFRSVPAKYTLREVHDPATGTYSYVVDQQMTLMAAYPAFSEMVSGGYKGTAIRLYVLKDPAEKELNILKKNYGIMTDTYFDSRNRLVTNAYLMLDQVVMLMNKYRDIKLEIAVHTDNQGGTAWTLQRLSETRAQVIVDYLVNRGINASRLTAKGYGDTRPVSPNDSWLDRRLNRRVDFTIIR